MPDFPLNLGALESKDPRNIPPGAVQAPVPFPEEFHARFDEVPTYYQNGQPACGGHAGAYLKSYLDYLSLQLAVPRSPRQLYAICKLVDGLPEHEGTTLNAIFKALRDYGVPQLSLYPNDVHLPKKQYRDASLIPPAAIEDAKKNRIAPGYAIQNSPSFDDVRRSVYLKQAAIILIYCDDGFFGTNDPTFNEKKYGHFVVAIPDYDHSTITAIDSTEPTTAFSAKRIPKSAFENGFIRQMGVAANLPNWQLRGLTSPIATKRFIYQQLIAAYTQLLKGR
ncbi:MAG TPA: hypothetical protein VGF48_10305 [Thermoanaerobaculia bacterium]|jgi:hypothetical protein